MNFKTGIAIILLLIVVGIGMAFVNPLTPPATTGGPPATGSQKLSGDAICESALAYMTFPSGAEANAFVQECKDGKHPEVIEHWKQQNGIIDERAI